MKTQETSKKNQSDHPPQTAILRLVEYLQQSGYVITLRPKNNHIVRVIEAA